MATDGIFVNRGGGVVHLDLARVSLAHYPIRVGKSAATPLQLVLSIIRADGSGKPHNRMVQGRIEDGKIVICGASGDSVYRLIGSSFGASADELEQFSGKCFVLHEADVLAEVELRREADDIVAACTARSTRYQQITGNFPERRTILMKRADATIPGWRRFTKQDWKCIAPAAFLDALRKAREYGKPATVTKAATPVPPAKEPAMPKPAPKPAAKPQPQPAPESKPDTLSPHARALVDALAKIGTPAVKATMLQTAGIPASAWSDALSEAYRARRITRDRSRTDNVYHVLAK
jgi:hypothetical protein